MATVVNARDVLLLAASPRLLWTGVRGVTVDADTTSFKVNAVGTPTPATINLTATLNGVNGTVVWSVPFGTATISPSGATCSLVYGNMSSNVITVRATVTDGGVSWTGNITLTKVVDGATGSTGATGAAGAAGDKSRIAYTLIDGFTLSTSPSTSTVTGDTGPLTGTWGETRAWTASPSVASVGQAVFQSTGTYNPTTNQTTWVVPYLSNLKVGNLSAITVNTGTLTVDNSGHIKGGQTAYNTGNGFWQGYDGGLYKMSIGTSNNRLTYDGSKLLFDVYGGDIRFGTTGVDASVMQVLRDTSTTLPQVLITDTSTSSSQCLAVQNTSSFTGNELVSFTATKGEALRATTSQSTQFAGVFQNLGGTTTALAIAGTTYSGYAGSGDGQMNIVDGYLPFTGIHIAMINKGDVWTVGDIVCSKEVLAKKDVSNTLLRVEVVSTTNNKCVFGVINKESLYENYLDFDVATWYNYLELYSGLYINSVGEGCINVCGLNGDIEAGDLITSSTLRGKGMKQSDDLVRNYTVAKSTENVKFDFPEQIKTIACTYMCG
jgi:hypothetical protein